MKNITKAGLALFLFILISCNQQSEHRKEHWYSSAVWSQDGTQVAYFKRYIEYYHTKPKVSFFIAEEEITNNIIQDKLFLCINDATGKSELVLKEVEIPIQQPDLNHVPKIHTTILWQKLKILYGAGQRDFFSTGLRQITPQGTSEKLMETGIEAIFDLATGPVIFDDLELYCGSGDYGYFGNRTIYLFDHKTKKVNIYLHDPLDRGKKYIPPYSVTGQ